MRDITDYVDWVAISMNINLSQVQLQNVAFQLVHNEKYKEALRELEDLIIAEKNMTERH